MTQRPAQISDDGRGEREERRTARVVTAIEEIGQAFLTSTDRRLVESWNPTREDCRYFLIEWGAIAGQHAVHHA